MAETPGRRNVFAEGSAVRPPAPGTEPWKVQRTEDPRIVVSRGQQPVPADPAKSIPQVFAEDLIADYDREANARPDLLGGGK